MSVLYFDCQMGAAGDMFSAALLDLLGEDEKAAMVGRLNALGIPGVEYEAVPDKKCGIGGTRLHVRINGMEEGHGNVHGDEAGRDRHGNCDHHDRHGHAHSHGEHHPHSRLQDINSLIDGLSASDDAKSNAKLVYQAIAEAESEVHGVAIENIHFHEVGTADAVADVMAACVLMEHLSPKAVYASPVNVGSGYVKCAHGKLAVPAPATALLLRDIPMYSNGIQGELCTPTGAALVKHFANGFSNMPVMKVSRIGYGMGSKDFEVANCLRAFYGEGGGEGAHKSDEIVELVCNIDDMTGEDLGFAFEKLIASECVLDAFIVAVQGKKMRPANMLTVLCRPDDSDAAAKLIFELTTTLGVRTKLENRYVLDRSIEEIDTPLGKVRKKLAQGMGIERSKLEYDDIAAMASRDHQGFEEDSR